MRRIAIITVVAVFALVGVGWAVSSTSGHSEGAGAKSGTSYSDAVLSRASQMTQQMSVPGPPSGHEYHAHAGDEQLRLASNPGFVREIEAYQNQIDRMLARTP
jgi:hypothetical protein